MSFSVLNAQPPLSHSFPFDPTHGYSLEGLQRVGPPDQPGDFWGLWRERYGRVRGFVPQVLVRREVGRGPLKQKIEEVQFTTTGGEKLWAWLVVPGEGEPWRGLVVGHGYGVDGSLDDKWSTPGVAVLYPFLRGLARSRSPNLPWEVDRHVVHGIDRRETYVLGGCVEDVWVSVSLLLMLFPKVVGRVGYMGTSFGGGVGALAIAQEERVQRLGLLVPSFGHQALRLKLGTVGSGAAVQAYARQRPQILGQTLVYHDAAIAARGIRLPALVGCALFDPAVAPAGQWAVANALAGQKTVLPIRAGHFDYAGAKEEYENVTSKFREFFARA